MRKLLRAAAKPGILVRSMRISLLVGMVLNLINQGDALLAWHAISWAQVALNFLVPFCVATYSAARQASTSIKPPR
ncbi:MAG: nitrate/nitrite transporter NrtS [Gammaproteobacteria bacterium]|nr:nitrate/nitrite transporter NrtS [Gammaproteobacteria bacterium]